MATLVAAEETTNGLLPSMGGENYEFAIPDVPEVRKFKDIHTSWLLAFYDRLNYLQILAPSLLPGVPAFCNSGNLPTLGGLSILGVIV